MNKTITKKSLGFRLKKAFQKNWQLYLIILVPTLYLLTFSYYPMLGLQIAFKKFNITQSMWTQPFVGFYQFERFFSYYKFKQLISNTLIISLYGLAISSFMPVILAIIINSMVSKRFSKAVQMVTYAPHFISVVVMVGILSQVLSMRTGFVNNMIVALGGSRINFMGEPKLFRHLYIWSGVWQGTGYSSIIYLAALSGISPELHEAAMIDGASKVQRVWHIDIPGILPTFIILLIMHTGHLLDTGYAKIFLFQNSLNINVAEVIDTYVYVVGMGVTYPGQPSSMSLPNYSYATAVGLFKSLIGLVLVMTVNKISSKVSETSLW